MQQQNKLTILLHCIELPGAAFEGRNAIRLGIQKGTIVIDDVPGDVETITFTCPMRVERNANTGKPNFLGPFAQGTPQERFIYLCWGERNAVGWAGFRRAKIHLKDISWASVEHTLSTGEPMEASIRMTDKKGEPLCASVKKEQIEWAF